MTQITVTSALNRAAENLRESIAVKRARARSLAEFTPEDKRLAFARNFTRLAVEAWWDRRQLGAAGYLPILPAPRSAESDSLPPTARMLAETMGRGAAGLDPALAGYELSVAYTETMPDRLRNRFGALFTPPSLCERLLDLAEQAGIDWSSARVLDPACGGGSVLVAAARRMAAASADDSAARKLEGVASRLVGCEIDPFCAWMSSVFLEAALLPLCLETGWRLSHVVEVCDALETHARGAEFDLVIGAPPQGRVKITPAERKIYRRSQFGPANFYGLFADLALRRTKPGGHVALVAPIGFLAGGSHKALRKLMAEQAPPTALDFVGARPGVFDFEDASQESLLICHRVGAVPAPCAVNFLEPRSDGAVAVESAGAFEIAEAGAAPWMAPRSREQAAVARAMRRHRHRIADYGYKVRSGPLTASRAGQRLRDRGAAGAYPMIWAESVRPEGVFEFQSRKRHHKPYIAPKPGDMRLVTDTPCVLLQRAASKRRRLVAAELPAEFLHRHKAVMVEKHLNMVRPVVSRPSISTTVLSALLNSAVVDQAFRCINQGGAVSAFEVEALPLPDPEALGRLAGLLAKGVSGPALETEIRAAYLGGEG